MQKEVKYYYPLHLEHEAYEANSLQEIRDYIFQQTGMAFPEEPQITYDEDIWNYFNRLKEWLLGWDIGLRIIEIPEPVEPEPTEEELAEQARKTRDELLDWSDKYMMEDYPITATSKTLMKEYRQKLRDIPSQEGFPINIEWPSQPATNIPDPPPPVEPDPEDPYSGEEDDVEVPADTPAESTEPVEESPTEEVEIPEEPVKEAETEEVKA